MRDKCVHITHRLKVCASVLVNASMLPQRGNEADGAFQRLAGIELWVYMVPKSSTPPFLQRPEAANTEPVQPFPLPVSTCAYWYSPSFKTAVNRQTLQHKRSVVYIRQQMGPDSIQFDCHRCFQVRSRNQDAHTAHLRGKMTPSTN